MAQRFIKFEYTADFVFGGLLKNTAAYQPLLMAIAVLSVKWLLLYFLYRKRIFFKV